jgi:hypothetical protein
MKIGDLVEHRGSLGMGIVIQCYDCPIVLYIRVYWYTHACYGSSPAIDLKVISES